MKTAASAVFLGVGQCSVLANEQNGRAAVFVVSFDRFPRLVCDMVQVQVAVVINVSLLPRDHINTGKHNNDKP
jgi:hypothetical protein